jgi:F420-0:gamma-glutamyl ligase
MNKTTVSVNDHIFERIPVKTHLILFGENLLSIIQKYVVPKFKNGDWVAISEKVVSVCQNNVRHISTVKAGLLAKILVKGVKKYPKDIGYSRPEKMQVAIETAGRLRIILAAILGGITKLFGIHGVFWIVAGKCISEIDGFNPDGMYPYTEYAVLPPKEPEKVCQEIEDKLGCPAVIIDGNNINVKVIAQSKGVPLNKKICRLILLDNPMGQGDELTPFIIVRKIK